MVAFMIITIISDVGDNSCQRKNFQNFFFISIVDLCTLQLVPIFLNEIHFPALKLPLNSTPLSLSTPSRLDYIRWRTSTGS